MDTNFIAELHPKIVHFPVALLSIYAVLEITGIAIKKDFISRCALLLLSLGVVAAFLAVLSGNQAFTEFQSWTEESKELVTRHQNYATFLSWFSFFACALRLYLTIKNKFVGVKKVLFIFFSVVILYLIYETAEHGGKLVSKFGVGTEIIMQEKSKP